MRTGLRDSILLKPARTHEEARAVIREGSGTHFDPDVVSSFLAIEERFREIARALNDGQGP